MSKPNRKWPGDSSWRRPLTLTVVGVLKPENTADARLELQKGAEAFGLQKLTRLHFLRFVLVEAEQDHRGRHFPARLILSAVFDGGTESFVADWIAIAAKPLERLFAHCKDFPRQGGSESLGDWMFAHARAPETYHIGALRHEIADMRAESALHDALQTHADERQQSGAWDHGEPCRIHRELRNYVASRPDLVQGPRDPTPPRIYLWQYLDLLKRLAFLLVPSGLLAWLLVAAARESVGLLLLATILTLADLTLVWFLVIRIHEWLEPDVEVTPPPGHVAALVDQEDFGVRNQFTMLTPVRDSLFRRLNLRYTLWLSNGFSRHLWNRGKLAGVATIHFARFHRLDKGRRLLFMSDFDGGWDRYLFDFLGKGSFAVVPNWTNLHGCPKTRFLIWPTRGFGQRFLPFTRAYQRPTDLWHNALGHLTLHDIQRNSRIRKGLFAHLKEREAREWLALL